MIRLNELVDLPESTMQFDPEKHAYTVGGRRLVSVTQVMQPLTRMIYEGVDTITMSTAANRGSRAHEQIEHIVKYGVEEVDPDTEPYIRAYKNFCRDYDPMWYESEYRTYHKNLRYAGTIDLIGSINDHPEDCVDIVDLKTTQRIHPKLLSCQLAAYAEALRTQGVKVRDVYGLQLKKDGSYVFVKIKEDMKLFLHCYAVWGAAMEEKNG